MDGRRRTAPIYVHSLIFCIALAGTFASAETPIPEPQPMSQFDSQNSPVASALNLSQFDPSATLPRPLVFDKDAFTRLFGTDLLITSYDQFSSGPDVTYSIFSMKDDAMAISLDVSQIIGKDRMKEALAGSFDGISAPLDHVEAVIATGVDRAARLSRADIFAVAARGNILVQVSTGKGISASEVAITVLGDIFAGR